MAYSRQWQTLQRLREILELSRICAPEFSIETIEIVITSSSTDEEWSVTLNIVFLENDQFWSGHFQETCELSRLPPFEISIWTKEKNTKQKSYVL